MDENTMKASILYDNILSNYRIWQGHGVGDRKSKQDLINAAVQLAKLGLPNPWKTQMKQMNAAVNPAQGVHITGVVDNPEIKGE